MGRSWGMWALAFLLALGCVNASASPDDYVLNRAYDDTPLLGPLAAKGAIVWNHGRGASAPTKLDMLPYYLDVLHEAGWDVYRLDRNWSTETMEGGIDALSSDATMLASRGYRRVVLAGQSYGAWISLKALAAGTPVYGVIATAPAAFGKRPTSPIYERNASDLYDTLGTVKRGRVMMFLFDDDPYDPGGRGPVSNRILDQNQIDHLVVDHPLGWSGHGAANWRGFANRFGPCIERFVDSSLPGAQADCAADPVTMASLKPRIGAPLPRMLKPDDLTGAWYGTYANGREAVLAVEALEGSAATALYAWGPRERSDSATFGTVNRSGRLADGTLVFDEPGLSTLRAKPRPDGLLDVIWSGADGHETLTTVMHRLQ